LIGCIALFGVILTASVVSARIMAPAPVSDRVAKADLVITGKVVSIEDKSIGDYQIAVVKIDDAILNAKGLTHVRVGFIPTTGGRFPHLNLQVDQESCFFLTQKNGQSFYVATQYFNIVDKKAANYEEVVKEAKQCGKLLGDADASLKAKDANDRMLTASMLITRYRTPREGAVKQEAIDAAQSKLILQTLADADWTPKNAQPYTMQPQQLFLRLGLTDKDGWTVPADVKELPDSAKKWLKDNDEKYRIQRFVVEKSDKKD